MGITKFIQTQALKENRDIKICVYNLFNKHSIWWDIYDYLEKNNWGFGYYDPFPLSDNNIGIVLETIDKLGIDKILDIVYKVKPNITGHEIMEIVSILDYE